jgi:hypothetical protein
MSVAVNGVEIKAYGDNIDAVFGAATKLRWDTFDANANMLKFDLPAGGGTDVPVALFGVGITGVDLTILNGTTQPFLGVISNDKATYGGFNFHSEFAYDMLQIYGNKGVFLETPTILNPPMSAGHPYVTFGAVGAVAKNDADTDQTVQGFYQALVLSASNTKNWTVWFPQLQAVVGKVVIAPGATGTIHELATFCSWPILDGMDTDIYRHFLAGNAAVTPPATLVAQYGFQADTFPGIYSYFLYGGANPSHFGGPLEISDDESLDAVANLVKIGAYEISAGHRALAISSEEVVVAAVGVASTEKYPVRLNGVTKNFMLCA